MASGLLALLDDVALIMDDLASATKAATKKTSALLADDLAVGAKKASGYASERELPVIWAIAKGSFVNKLVILPAVFLLSYFVPFLITPIILIGGIYLSYEGAEKIIDFVFHRGKAKKALKEMTEKEKIRSAIITDFILSLEIVIIALSTVQDKPFSVQVVTVSIIAFLATVGVYGLVALIVRMDDFGLSLMERYDGFLNKTGYFLIISLPYVIKALSVIGTVAMLAVGGGIFVHNTEFFHSIAERFIPYISDIFIGFFIGVIAVLIVKSLKFLKRLVYSEPS
ncbi:hypothetical protein SAMN06265182_1817 [Persephonella hydrogeniphila]|uniref:Inner membrane protein YedI n=1 Tax=Persephonella hydrogeniphila TaxID=198703 RepID=A0A285NLA5_9AQUI|nr:DUF808 family protein [Persephonella hydrogeniphila]SNZ10314.1 hypothetical protein SAMN06265182_1817 [Persephonella hydrogeniphila]